LSKSPQHLATALLEKIRAGQQCPLGYSWPPGLVAALNEAEDPAVFLALATILMSKREIVRANAASALGEAGNPEALYTLQPLLEDQSDLVRGRALDAVERLGPCDDLDAILSRLATSDPLPNLRKSAIRSLGQLRSPQSDAALRAALNDPNPEVSAAAEETCKRFKRSPRG
jgi:HEAT repeat protein